MILKSLTSIGPPAWGYCNIGLSKVSKLFWHEQVTPFPQHRILGLEDIKTVFALMGVLSRQGGALWWNFDHRKLLEHGNALPLTVLAFFIVMNILAKAGTSEGFT